MSSSGLKHIWRQVGPSCGDAVTWLLLISGTASLTVYADRKFGPSKRAAIRIQKLTARMEWEQDQVELQKWWTAYYQGGYMPVSVAEFSRGLASALAEWKAQTPESLRLALEQAEQSAPQQEEPVAEPVLDRDLWPGGAVEEHGITAAKYVVG
ncbi:uncharacterized protein EHS24_003794 [Apiotrichum porosum]|uniref:Uncharacterized protein n=1 Tax=Apiotrichum porosum TaxID=105984 RepID=A0A427XE11_9TREE|nr:uncharacterized protein EHS24_003794 [Apiotrichum porosum]RSH77160.1 hypothetical protein EHS24_003794 [Apiotrichum porosum]